MVLNKTGVDLIYKVTNHEPKQPVSELAMVTPLNANVKKVLAALKKLKCTSRTQLGDATGFSLSMVDRCIRMLVSCGKASRTSGRSGSLKKVEIKLI